MSTVYLPNADVQTISTTVELWLFGDIRHIRPCRWLRGWSINTLKNKK